MSMEGLKSGASFTVREVQSNTPKEKADLVKSLENNGKADIVLDHNDKTFVISGEKIDIKEVTAMLKGSAPAKANIFREESALYHANSNKDGVITEKDLKWGASKLAKESLSFMGGKISSETELGSLGGYVKMQNLGMALRSPTVLSVGGFVGSGVGGTIGFLKGVCVAPFQAISESSKAHGKYHTAQDNLGFNDRIRTIR